MGLLNDYINSSYYNSVHKELCFPYIWIHSLASENAKYFKKEVLKNDRKTFILE